MSHALPAQALSTAFSRLWFLPLDARTRLVHARLAAAVVKALGFFLGARALARRLPPDEVAESPAPAVARRTAAIFAALGVFDAVSYFVDEFLDLGSQDVVLAYWAYAALASAAAVTHRERKRRRTRRVRTSEDLRRSNDAAFDEAYEAWTVAFAFWTPFLDCFVRLYRLADATDLGLKLAWQLFLIVVVVVSCGVLDALGTLCFADDPHRDARAAGDIIAPSGYVHLQDAGEEYDLDETFLASSTKQQRGGGGDRDDAASDTTASDSEHRPSGDAGPRPVLTRV